MSNRGIFRLLKFLQQKNKKRKDFFYPTFPLNYSKTKLTSPDNKVKSTNLEMIATIVDILFNVLSEQSLQNFYDYTPNPKIPEESLSQSTCRKNTLISTQEDIINSLYEIFFQFSKSASSSKQRKRRNDLIMLFTILVEHNPTFFVSSGIMNTLLLFSIQPEYTHTIAETHKNLKLTKLTNNNEDFEFKKLTWLFVNKIAAFPAALRCISDSNVLEIFFEFINPELKTVWSNTQRNELQSLALDCLCNLTPILLGFFGLDVFCFSNFEKSFFYFFSS